jgi:hypothetical protein
MATEGPIYISKRKVRDPKNYRGVSLLPVLGKCFSSILAARLSGWLMNNKILSRYQAGFITKIITIDNILSSKQKRTGT